MSMYNVNIIQKYELSQKYRLSLSTTPLYVTRRATFLVEGYDEEDAWERVAEYLDGSYDNGVVVSGVVKVSYNKRKAQQWIRDRLYWTKGVFDIDGFFSDTHNDGNDDDIYCVSNLVRTIRV